MGSTTRKGRPIPLLHRFHGRSKSAREARALLAEETGVDEATVEGWVAGEELPPDEVIVSLLGPCGPMDARLTYELGWGSVTTSAVPERWRPMIAMDTVLRMEYVLPGGCDTLLGLLDERLSVDPPTVVPDDAPAVSWRGPVPRFHSREQCQRLRRALLEFMSEPLDDAED